MDVVDVTIGIPAFNEAEFIETAVRSAAGQCSRLVVADNASNDGTREICAALCEEFPHMELLEQPRNIGAAENFWCLLAQAQTPMFMWLGAHDSIPPNYVISLKRAHAAMPNCVLAYAPARHVFRDGRENFTYEYDFGPQLLHPSGRERLLTLIRDLDDCSLVHGLFRTAALRACGPIEQFIGADHVLLSRAILAGPFAYAPGTYLIRRDIRPEDSTSQQLTRLTGVFGQGAAQPYADMQRVQFAMISAVSAGTGLNGAWTRMRARIYLTRRFGLFAQTGVERFIQQLIRLYLRTARRLSALR